MDLLTVAKHYWQELVVKFVFSNQPVDYLLAASIFFGSVLLLKLLLYYVKVADPKLISQATVTQWSQSLINWPLKLILYVILFRISEIPLTLNPLQTIFVHFFEGLIIALASAVYVSKIGNHISNFIIESSSFGEDDVFTIYIKRIKNLTSLILYIGIAFLFAVIQKNSLPTWFVNTNWWRYLLSFAFIVLLWSMSVIMGKLLIYMTQQLQGSNGQIRLRLLLSSLLWPIRLLLLALVVYLTSSIFRFTGKVQVFFSHVVSFLAIVAGILLIYKLLDVIDSEMRKFVEREDNLLDKTFAQMVRLILRLTVLVIGIIYLIQTLSGQPISTLMAGLGIGALAIALAAQDTLKNLFGSVMIMADKPFTVGQRVLVDGFDGEIESVGFRSTQIRTLTGHLVTIPNEKMASSSIENIGRRPHIRRLINIGITYDTPPAKVEKAVEICQNILENHEGLHPDFPPKVFFEDFKNFSLNIRVFYWYHPADYWLFMEFGEKVNLAIMRAFEEEGIEFAFPTSTTFLAQDDKRPLSIGIQGNSEDQKK